MKNLSPSENDTLIVPALVTFTAGVGAVPASVRARQVLKLLQRRFGFRVAWLASETNTSEGRRE
jgi:hypothetical protein